MEKMNSEKVGKVIGTVLAVFLLAMVIQPSIVSAQSDQGAIEIFRVSLNFVGLEDWSDVKPGELLEARVYYDYLYPWHLQKHEYRVVVGYEDTALFCIDEEIRREYPDNTGDGSDCTIFTIKAPMEPGIYSIYKTYTKGLTCSEAKEHYENNPDAREIIDHFEVKADVPDEPDEPDDPDEWECIHVSAATIDLGIYGRHPYSITFLQREDKLRMEINTLNSHSVGDGSLSTSVSEDVGVYYDGGKVFEIPYPHPHNEINFIETEFNPENKVGIALVSLIVGVVPYAGFCSGVAGFVMAVAEEAGGFSVYEETDLTGHFEKPIALADVFSKSRYLNDRDVVIVPWHVRLREEPKYKTVHHSKTVRVDLPDMKFPYEGTHDVVFCVDCVVYYKDVRHYIALPIEIGKQKIEA